MPNSDPRQINTPPLVLVGLGLGVEEGLGLGNRVAILRRVIIWQGVENGHNTAKTGGGATNPWVQFTNPWEGIANVCARIMNLWVAYGLKNQR